MSAAIPSEPTVDVPVRVVAEHPVILGEAVRYDGRDGIVTAASLLRDSPLSHGPYQIVEVRTATAHVLVATDNPALELQAWQEPCPFVAAEVVFP